LNETDFRVVLSLIHIVSHSAVCRQTGRESRAEVEGKNTYKPFVETVQRIVHQATVNPKEPILPKLRS